MKYKPLMFLLFLFAICNAFSQPGDALIDPAHFNYRLLEYFIKVKIDSVRQLNKLGKLSNDSLLFMAATDQARYLQKQKEIGHEQPGKRKKDPLARARYYGAEYQVIGENVARIFYLVRMKNPKLHNREVFISSYEQAANEFVEGWVHSPPHYKNILGKDYNVTGVAVSVNPKDNSINAAQVFGKAPSTWEKKPSLYCFPFDH